MNGSPHISSPIVKQITNVDTKIKFRKFVHTKFCREEFELGSLGPQAVMVPIEPTLLIMPINYPSLFLICDLMITIYLQNNS